MLRSSRVVDSIVLLIPLGLWRNAKFLENDLVSGSGQFLDTLPEKDHHQSQAHGTSHRLTSIHTFEVESDIRRSMYF